MTSKSGLCVTRFASCASAPRCPPVKRDCTFAGRCFVPARPPAPIIPRRGGESRSDFIHKLQIVLKELRETAYWLRVVAAAGLLPVDKLTDVIDESDQLIAIVVQSLVTARRNAHNERS